MKDVYVNQSCMDASCTGPWLWSSAWFSLLGLFGHTAFSNRPAKQSENGECQECYEIFLTNSPLADPAPDGGETCPGGTGTVYTTDQGKGTIAPLFAHICTRHRILILFDFFGSDVCDVFLFALTAYVGHMLQGMRIVECGNCRTPQCQA